ncbi:uncharacterized protein EI97DRAFT_20137 [Westerdykella ornata]|uniref:Uncharacterized protein n=1 Tax=Westerdykella ornata TaxID=318751 RepID=A0A6A6JWW3_WESOR|nr:uncharacterized protein EI97DRAFT_20137 [Westerdykella ornata]KAF2281101.1 hypothetical protein EI97DRAFT_20137 [Westerdykella ornata]
MPTTCNSPSCNDAAKLAEPESHDSKKPAATDNKNAEGTLRKIRRLFEYLREASLKDTSKRGISEDPAWEELEAALDENSFSTLESASRDLQSHQRREEYEEWFDHLQEEIKRRDYVIRSQRADLINKDNKIRDLELEITAYLADDCRRRAVEPRSSGRKRGGEGDRYPLLFFSLKSHS